MLNPQLISQYRQSSATRKCEWLLPYWCLHTVHLVYSKYCDFLKWGMVEFHHRGPSFAFPCQKQRKDTALCAHCSLFCVCFQPLCLWFGFAMIGSELKSNLRCFTVISRLCCCCGDCCTDSECGKRGLQGGWGWMCERVGSRVGVGLFFCSLHFSPSPSREGMGWGSCHLTCECFEGGPGVFRKLSFFCPPPTPFFTQKQHGVSEPQLDPEEGLCWMRRGREWEKKAQGR